MLYSVTWLGRAGMACIWSGLLTPCCLQSGAALMTLARHDGHGAPSCACHVPAEPRALRAEVLVAKQMDVEIACQAGLLDLLPLHPIAYSWT